MISVLFMVILFSDHVVVFILLLLQYTKSTVGVNMYGKKTFPETMSRHNLTRFLKACYLVVV